ncbi:MAG: PIG-L deacetylase family protein [Gemmatimonadales bacterium]
MRILVISVHPDDETVGCGGTMLKHRAAGDTLSWLIVTQAFEPAWPAEAIARKAKEVEAVARAYGVEKVYRLGQPTTRLDTVAQADLMDAIRKVGQEVRPDVVYLVNRSDIHSDHRVVFECVMAVFKPFHTHLGARRILCYECLSSTEAAPALAERAFVPTVYSDITEHIERKLDVMRLYASESQEYPKPRAIESIRALGRYRGASIGVEYAEAFMLLREVW